MRIASLIAVVMVGFSSAGAQAAPCPEQAEVQATLQKYVETELWSPSQRDLWNIANISDFNFGPIKTGRIIEKQMEYGKAAQEVCPIRIEYSFKVTHEDGRVETTSKGAGETHFFYLNAFDEWTYKVGS